MPQSVYNNQVLHFLLFQLVFLPLNLTHSSFLPDIYLRWDYAATPLTGFFFFWTTFLYVPAFFTSLFLVVYSLSVEKKVLLLLIPAVYYYFYFYEILEASASNLVSHTISHTSFQYNLLLINPLNKYHPLLLYLAITITTTYVLNLVVSSLHSNTIYYRYFSKVLSLLLKFGFLLIITSLFLGSWWALQEGTWGGWWNWDPSEVFGLLYFIFYITFLHEKKFNNMFYKVKLRGVLNLFFIKWVYFFIQINFKIVSHNFGLQFVFFFNNLFFFLQILFSTTIFLIFLVSSFFTFNQQSESLTRYKEPIFLSKNSFFFSKILIIIVTLSLLFLRSFQAMFFLFFKEYFGINFFNDDFSCNLSNPIFLILVLFPLFCTFKNKNHIFASIQLLFTSKYAFLGLVFLNKRLSLFTLVHVNLFLFFFLNTISLNDISFLPSDLGLVDFIDFFTTNIIWVDSNYNIDGLIISRNYYLGVNFSESWVVSSNTFLSTNATTSNNFFFLFSNTHFFNIFFLTTYESKFSFLIDFLHLSSLLLPLFGIFWFLIK